jgi:exocyst complex component 2
MPRVSGPDDLTDRLASELRVCVPLLESKQGEATIGDSQLVIGVLSSLTLWLATTGNRELWEATVAYLKNVSEVMIMSLPSFWRIAKNFLDGKYKRVSRSGIRRDPR